MKSQMHETEDRDSDSGHMGWCLFLLVATTIRAGGMASAASSQREREGGKRSIRIEQLTVERARLQAEMAEINIRLRRLGEPRIRSVPGTMRCVNIDGHCLGSPIR